MLGGGSGAPVQVLLYYRSHADVAASQQGVIGKKKKNNKSGHIWHLRGEICGACRAIKTSSWLLPFMISAK